MSQDIYQQGIKELAAAEHGAGELENADTSVTVDNPLCGDRITLEIKLEGEHIVALAHKVRGCLLCRASASAIGAAAVGASKGDIDEIQSQLTAMLKSEAHPQWSSQWQPLSLFQPVQAHKSRHGCVLLPFKALTQAFRNSSG